MEWALAVVTLTLIGFAIVSRRVDGTSLTPAIVFVGVGLLVGARALGLVDTPPASESVKLLAEATLTVVLFADASRINLRTLRKEYAVPARLLGIGLPLTIVLGAIVAAALVRRADGARSARARRPPRPHRCRPRPGRRDGAAAPVQDPPGPQRREWPQRRHLRPAALHRARGRGGGFGRDERLPRRHPRLRADRVRHSRRPDRRRRRSACDHATARSAA